MEILNNILWNVFHERLKTKDNLLMNATICRSAKTHEDRIILVLKLWKKINYKPLQCSISKNASDSERFREDGNKLYVSDPLTSEKCLEAFKLYGKSLAYAPLGSKQQAMAHANRSAVLCRMKKYVESLKDVERAIALDYPDALRSKLYLRKIECLVALNSPLWEDAVKEAKSWLDRMSINETNSIKFNDKISYLRMQVMLKVDISKDDKLYSFKPSVPIIQNPNPEVACASDAIAIKYNSEWGRHVVATRDIKPGEVLVAEKPYAKLLSPENVHTHCHSCLQVCWATIPCNSCVYAMYCSEECKNADWKASHDIECQLFAQMLMLEFSKLDLMTVRLTIIAIRQSGGIDKLKKLMKEVDEHQDKRTKGFSKDGVYHSDEYRSVYSLATNTEKRDGFNLLRRAFDASVITYFLSLCSYESLVPKFDENTFLFVGALVLRHQEMIPTNGHSTDEELEMSTQERGLTMMPFLSLINHACDNNILRHSTVGHTVVYSLYPIEKGEQIMDNYGAHYALKPRTERQKQLLYQYFFFCGCLPCREDWPLYNNTRSYKILVRSSAKRRVIAKALENCESHYPDAAQFYKRTDTSEIIKALFNMITVLYANAPLPCREMNNAVETLKRYYGLRGDRFDWSQI